MHNINVGMVSLHYITESGRNEVITCWVWTGQQSQLQRKKEREGGEGLVLEGNVDVFR